MGNNAAVAAPRQRRLWIQPGEVVIDIRAIPSIYKPEKFQGAGSTYTKCQAYIMLASGDAILMVYETPTRSMGYERDYLSGIIEVNGEAHELSMHEIRIQHMEGSLTDPQRNIHIQVGTNYRQLLGPSAFHVTAAQVTVCKSTGYDLEMVSEDKTVIFRNARIVERTEHSGVDYDDTREMIDEIITRLQFLKTDLLIESIDPESHTDGQV